MCHIPALLGRQTAYFPLSHHAGIMEWSEAPCRDLLCMARSKGWILRQDIPPSPYFSMPSRLTLDPLLVHIHIQLCACEKLIAILHRIRFVATVTTRLLSRDLLPSSSLYSSSSSSSSTSSSSSASSISSSLPSSCMSSSSSR